MNNAFRFKKMPEIFSSQSHLGSLVQRAQALAELNRRLQLALPGAVRGQCQLANVRQDTVVLVCPSQIEASKLRMFSRQILQIIQDDFKIPAKKLRIKVSARALSAKR